MTCRSSASAAIVKLKTKLESIENVKDISDNAQFGKTEYKLRINSYGEQLGLSESYVAQVLSGYFLDSRKAMTFGENGIMEIRTRSEAKDVITSYSIHYTKLYE